MIDRGHELALSRQAAVLGISRGSLYYSACPVSPAELAIMRRLDALHLEYPFAGSRMLRDLLRGEGIAVGRGQVRTMMRRMAIEALYRRPHTSKPADGDKVFPYLRKRGDGSTLTSCWSAMRRFPRSGAAAMQRGMSVSVLSLRPTPTAGACGVGWLWFARRQCAPGHR